MLKREGAKLLNRTAPRYGERPGGSALWGEGWTASRYGERLESFALRGEGGRLRGGYSG